jgi:hypothetical protein
MKKAVEHNVTHTAIGDVWTKLAYQLAKAT